MAAPANARPEGGLPVGRRAARRLAAGRHWAAARTLACADAASGAGRSNRCDTPSRLALTGSPPSCRATCPPTQPRPRHPPTRARRHPRLPPLAAMTGFTDALRRWLLCLGPRTDKWVEPGSVGAESAASADSRGERRHRAALPAKIKVRAENERQLEIKIVRGRALEGVGRRGQGDDSCFPNAPSARVPHASVPRHTSPPSRPMSKVYLLGAGASRAKQYRVDVFLFVPAELEPVDATSSFYSQLYGEALGRRGLGWWKAGRPGGCAPPPPAPLALVPPQTLCLPHSQPWCACTRPTSPWPTWVPVGTRGPCLPPSRPP